MRRNHYYLASRVPSKGGLKIIRTDSNFPKEYAEQIEEKCLEMFVPEYEHNAVMIYPLDNEVFAIALARKVAQSRYESRVHEDIHGCLMNMRDFSVQILPELSGVEFDNCFYDWKIEDAERLSDELLYYHAEKNRTDGKIQFLDQLKPEGRVGFFYAVYQTILKQEKIHLIVPEEMCRTIQAACYEILPYYFRNKLFTISCGECTQTDANIILTDNTELQYQDSGRYKRVELSDFIKWGMHSEKNHFKYLSHILGEKQSKRNEVYRYMDVIVKEIKGGKNTEQSLMSVEFYDLLADIIIHADEGSRYDDRLIQKVKKIKDSEIKRGLLQCFPSLCQADRKQQIIQINNKEENSKIELCLEYLRNTFQVHSLPFEIREYYFNKDRKNEWNIFQAELRDELERISLLPKRKKQYVTLLFLAYENYKGKELDCGQNILSAPYNIEGMLLFLRQKVKTEREYKKYTAEVLRQYNERFTIYMPEKKIRNLLKPIRKGLGKYFKDVGEKNV